MKRREGFPRGLIPLLSTGTRRAIMLQEDTNGKIHWIRPFECIFCPCERQVPNVEAWKVKSATLVASLLKKMALGFEKLTEKMKHTTKEHHSEGGHGHHSEHHGESGGDGHPEDKTTAPTNPVLIERPGASQTSKLDGKGLRITIVASHWYEKVVHSLVDACSQELLAKGVAEDCLHLVEVAGAFELPFTAARLIDCKDKSRRPDAVICIGCIVKDPTHMSETMSQAVAHGIMKLNVTSDTPVIFGVLCCDSEPQAQSCVEKRSCCGIDEGHKCNHGVSWAQSALQMAHLKCCSSAKEMEHCCCTRCVGRSSGKSGERKSVKHGKHESSSKHGLCTSCKLSVDDCNCEDCKCRSCCVEREACSGCGCPARKCSCDDCHCATCKGTMTKDVEHENKKEAVKIPSSECEKSSSGCGGSAKCDTCGSPDGQCKCGLLH